MRFGEIGARIHLGQATDRAFEFGGLRSFGIQIFGGTLGGGNQFDLVVVEHVRQPGQATRFRSLMLCQTRDAGEQYGMVAREISR